MTKKEKKPEETLVEDTPTEVVEEIKEEEVEVEAEEVEAEEEEAEVEVEAEEEDVTVEVKKNSDETDPTKYGVYTEKGVLVKTYTEQNHGPDFAELASAYAKRKGGGLVAKELIVTPGELIDTEIVEVVNASNQLIRTYSKKTHGRSYKKLAEKFVDKYGEKKGYKIK